jgi:diguanylate cyclase (GGDEF)-like protein
MQLFARDVYLRTLKLREASAQLSASESSLQQTNAALQQKLDEIHRLQHRLNEQATHDALTGLHNRHFLGNAFDKTLARCRQDNLPLAVVLIDVDHFKQVNDVYGHLAGDEVLKQLARRLDSSAQASDVVCRYGGEEFLLLLVGMDLQGALSRADALRQQVEHKGIDWESTVLHVTVSAGVALFPTHGTHPDALIQAADLALYRAKSLGRNRVMAAS